MCFLRRLLLESHQPVLRGFLPAGRCYQPVKEDNGIVGGNLDLSNPPGPNNAPQTTPSNNSQSNDASEDSQ